MKRFQPARFQSKPHIKTNRRQINTFFKYGDIILIPKGDAFMYDKIRRGHDHLNNYRLFLYQREPIDIGYQMIKSNVDRITYISRSRFQSVVAVCKNGKNIQLDHSQKDNKEQNTRNTKDQQQISSIKGNQTNKEQLQTDKSIDNKNSQMQVKLLKFLQQNKILIRKTFLDYHPCDSYHKVKDYLKLPNVDLDDISLTYRYCAFTKEQIKKNIFFKPELTKLITYYLNTGQLKTRKLDRLRDPTPQEIQNTIRIWKQAYWLDNVYHTNQQQQIFKYKFALKYQIGKYVTLQEIKQGKGETTFYAQWEDSLKFTNQNTKISKNLV